MNEVLEYLKEFARNPVAWISGIVYGGGKLYRYIHRVNAESKGEDAKTAKHKTEIARHEVEAATYRNEKELRELVTEMQKEMTSMQKEHIESVQKQTAQHQKTIQELRTAYDAKIEELSKHIDRIEKEIHQHYRNNISLTGELDRQLRMNETLQDALAAKEVEIQQLTSEIKLFHTEGFLFLHRSQEHRADLAPRIALDEQNCALSIIGRSLIDNTYAESVFAPMMLVLENYFKRHDSLTVLFRVPDHNSVSNRAFTDLCTMLEKAKTEAKNIMVTWQYKADNEGWLEDGKDLLDGLTIEYEFEPF